VIASGEDADLLMKKMDLGSDAFGIGCNTGLFRIIFVHVWLADLIIQKYHIIVKK
jgi:hypothetical protein